MKTSASHIAKIVTVIAGFSVSTCAFAKIDLLEAYQFATKYDAKLQQAQLRYQQVQQLENQARAALLPSIDLKATAGYTTLDQRSKSASPDVEGDYTTVGTAVTLYQPIFNQTVFSGLTQTEVTIQQAATSYELAQLDLMVRTTQAYLQVLAAEDDQALVNAEKRAVQRQLEQNEKRFEVGLIAITDVEETRARRDQIIANEIAAINELENAKEALFELTGKPIADIKSLSPSFLPAPPANTDVNYWVGLAQKANKEIQTAALGVEVASAAIDVEKSSHYPTVDLTGQYGIEDRSNDINTGAETTSGNLQLTLTIPLYRGGSVSSKVKEARLAYQEAQALYDETFRRVTRQTRNALRNVMAGISQTKALDTALNSTKISLEATEAGFDVGTRTAVQLLDAQRAVYLAQRNYQAARYQFLISRLNLALLTGQLTLEDIQRINANLQ